MPEKSEDKISVGILHVTSLEKCSCRLQFLISPTDETTVKINPINFD